MPKLVAEGTAAETQLFRSVSARQSTEDSIFDACEKRRSTSFDDTHGELVGDAHTLEPDSGISKKKPSFWHSKMWKFSKGKKDTLPSIPEKEEGMAFKWKKLFRKIRSKAKDARKPAICSSSLDLRIAHCDRSGLLRGEGTSKASGNQAEKQQRHYSVYPEPMLVSQRSTSIAIWERRSVACPPALNLDNLRVTGLRHLSRPNQTRG